MATSFKHALRVLVEVEVKDESKRNEALKILTNPSFHSQIRNEIFMHVIPRNTNEQSDKQRKFVESAFLRVNHVDSASEF